MQLIQQFSPSNTIERKSNIFLRLIWIINAQDAWNSAPTPNLWFLNRSLVLNLCNFQLVDTLVVEQLIKILNPMLQYNIFIDRKDFFTFPGRKTMDVFLIILYFFGINIFFC